ncbi:MAG: RNA polymerase sigma factor [bacterium]
MQQKDRDAFIKTYDLYLDSIYRFVYFKVSNKEEAEDLTSSVFLKTWDYIQNNNISDYKTLKALLYKVARNLIIDYYRKKNSQSNVGYNAEITEDILDQDQDLYNKVETEFDYKIIERKIFELKDEYREVIILKYINELSISEIAEVIGKSNGNVRVLIYRATNALKKIADK